ncbi:MAG: hypothetical protein ABIV94_08690 [Acidimicrobiales bacterium]
MNQTPAWDMWVDFSRVYDGMTYGDLRDATAGVSVAAGRYLIVGDDDADPAVAQVIEVRDDGVVLLKVFPGHADLHRELLHRQPA